MTRVFGFLLDSRGPDELLNRAAASLGLLPQVSWTQVEQDIDFRPPAGPSILCISLDPPPRERRPRHLVVTLRTDDSGTRAFVQSLLELVSGLYSREIEAQRLADEAHTDPLTSLWNRRAFDPFLDQAISRSERHGESLALLLCDIDLFKGINDRFGHAAGDQALNAVAEAIREVIRPCDVSARLGGDEIAILLSGADRKGAMAVAERLQNAVNAANPLALHPLTLSIGIADHSVFSTGDAASNLPEAKREALFEAADEGLYLAKAQGRNCARVSIRCADAE